MRSLAVTAILAAILAGCGGEEEQEQTDLIAYQTQSAGPSDIMMMNGDGTSPRFVIADASEPNLRSDGRLIALVKDNNIYTVGADGTGLYKVTNYGLGVDVGRPALSPSGNEIAYVLTPEGAVPEIHIVRSDGISDVTLVTDAIDPTWRQDGLRIAFARGPDIYTIGIDSAGLTNVTNSGTGVAAREPAYEPTQVRIAYTEEAVVPFPIPSVRIVDLVSGEKTTLVAIGAHPTWRPDGQRVAFANEGDIYSVRWDGTDIQQLTSGPALDSHPSWALMPRRRRNQAPTGIISTQR